MEKAMSDFVYYNPVKVLFGKNKISELGALIPDGKKF